jgi:hypothetical protein
MDEVTLNMQNMIMETSQDRLGEVLSQEIIEKIKTKYQSYIALEMIIDMIKSIEIENLKKYLEDL